MSDKRVFDASAIEEYRQFLQGLLDQLEAEVIPVLSEGTLSKAPAFGSAPGASDALDEYLGFHATSWRNLQHLRGTLHGLVAGLAEAAASETAAADDEVAAMFAGFDAANR